LTWFELGAPCGDDGDSCTGTICIIASPNSGGESEGDCVIQVHRFPFGFVFVRIYQNNFLCQPTQQQGIGAGGTYITGTYNGNSGRTKWFCYHLFLSLNAEIIKKPGWLLGIFMCAYV
jgi:hypothetical protein